MLFSPSGGRVQSLSFPRSTTSYELTGLRPQTKYIFTLYTQLEGREVATPVSTEGRGQPGALHYFQMNWWVMLLLNSLSMWYVYWGTFMIWCCRGPAGGKRVQPEGGRVTGKYRQTWLDGCNWSHTVPNRHPEHGWYDILINDSVVHCYFCFTKMH